MMYDIAALQRMYGADFTTNAGDTVYSWNPTDGTTYVDGNVAIDPGGNRIFETIWDGGGIDTYDLSNYSTDLSLDLNPGYHSVFSQAQLADLDIFGGHTARGNVFNALQYNGDVRSLIENAKGGSGNDQIVGNAANNILYGNDGNDSLTGFAGNDALLGGNGNDWLDGHVGNDQMYGGDGNDIYYVDSFADVVIEDTKDAIGGVDLVFAYVATNLSFGVENLTIIASGAVNGHGNELANVIQGASGQNELYGNAGNDRLSGLAGNDVLSGGEGNDRLLGGAGSDLLFGGKGADVFDFDLVGDSPTGAGVRDICQSDGVAIAFEGAGASGGDLIDLSGIDANVNAGGNQAFVFGGGGIGRDGGRQPASGACGPRARPCATAVLEHEGNRAVRSGKWKLVSTYPHEWELYDMTADRVERNDLAASRPDLVRTLAAAWDAWAARANVDSWPGPARLPWGDDASPANAVQDVGGSLNRPGRPVP